MQHEGRREASCTFPDALGKPATLSHLPAHKQSVTHYMDRPTPSKSGGLPRAVSIELPEVAGIRCQTSADGSAYSAKAALNRLYELQEEAAKRIAHRLHDESAQMLALVYLELAEIASDCPPPMVNKIDRAQKKLDEVCDQLRNLSHELRPLILDQLGLMPALQFLADGVKKRSGLKLSLSGSLPRTIPQPIENALYRVVQEALSNVVRHAQATQAQVKLWIEGDKIYCTVGDNGIGYKTPDKNSDGVYGLGLVGINERVSALNGDCKIVSRWRNGMELNVEIPL